MAIIRSESYGFPAIRCELHKLKKNTFKEVKEPVAKTNSGLELTLIELNELERQLVTLVKDLIQRVGNFRHGLEAEGGGDY